MLKGRTFDLNSGAKRFHTLLFTIAGCVILIAVAYVIGVISEKRAKGEEKIKREKNFSENIVATVPNSLLVLDKDLRVKSANRTFHPFYINDLVQPLSSQPLCLFHG